MLATVAFAARTMVEASGTRRDGEAFFSQAWVSSYEGPSGRRLTVILSDITEQIRDREESGLRQLLSNSRIIAGAVPRVAGDLLKFILMNFRRKKNFAGWQ